MRSCGLFSASCIFVYTPESNSFTYAGMTNIPFTDHQCATILAAFDEDSDMEVEYETCMEITSAILAALDKKKNFCSVASNGTERNGTERNGTERNGTERNG